MPCLTAPLRPCCPLVPRGPRERSIAQLRPGTFFLGAGEVDLKLGMSASDFIAAYQASARPRGGSPTRRSPQG
jgi:hypothetical protein